MSKLSKNETADLSMELVAYAGESTSLNLKAIAAIQNHNLELANQLQIEAENELMNAHKTHTQIIQNDAQDIEPYIDTLFIHAQNHLTTALIYNDLTKIIIDLYIKLDTEIESKNCNG